MIDLASMTHEPLNRSPKVNWVERAGQLPAYIQHIAKDIHEQKGVPLSVAIPTAIAAVKRWAAGGGNVTAETRAKAAAAVAEWEALKAKSHANLAAEQGATVDLAAWDGAKHPRVSKGKSGGGRFAAKQGQQQQSSGGALPDDMAAQVRDFQRRHGLAQTGTFDAATNAAIQYHASGAAGKAASASKKHAKSVAAAKKKADAAAKRAAKAKASAASKAAKAKASAAKRKDAATVSAVNKLTPAQRKEYRRKAPTAPAGYAWSSDNKLVTSSAASASAGVSKTLGLAERVAGIDLATSVTSTTDGPKLTFLDRMKLLRKRKAMPPATPGGQPRFPIETHADVKRAVRAVGRAKGDHGKVRAHIARRARAIGASHLIPSHWPEAKS